MTILFQNDLTQLDAFDILAERAEIVTWQGRQALHLENGLALIRNCQLDHARVQVAIGVDGSAYPGVAFRVADKLNFELAYAVPHVTGQWDALQYDPVFHGSNTWQIYHDQGYQATAHIPTDDWFELKVDFHGSCAAISIDDQPPLIVSQLARSNPVGLFGLWTFRPAYFCDLRISACNKQDIPHGQMPTVADNIFKEWFIETYGVVTTEPNGIINLNRHFPITVGEVRLTRRFELSEESKIRFDFGFSDVLALELDGKVIFQGEKLFSGFSSRTTRGLVELDHSLEPVIAAGEHRLTAVLGAAEYFGWGWMFTAHADELHWLPAEWG